MPDNTCMLLLTSSNMKESKHVRLTKLKKATDWKKHGAYLHYVLSHETRLSTFKSQCLKSARNYDIVTDEIVWDCGYVYPKLARCIIPSWIHQDPHQAWSQHSFLSSKVQRAYLQVGGVKREIIKEHRQMTWWYDNLPYFIPTPWQRPANSRVSLTVISEACQSCWLT